MLLAFIDKTTKKVDSLKIQSKDEFLSSMFRKINDEEVLDLSNIKEKDIEKAKKQIADQINAITNYIDKSNPSEKDVQARKIFEFVKGIDLEEYHPKNLGNDPEACKLKWKELGKKIQDFYKNELGLDI